MVGAVLLRDRQLVSVARERDNLGAATKQLRVLNCVRAESADAKNADDTLPGPSAPASRSFLMPRYGVRPASVRGAICSNFRRLSALIR